MSRFLVVTGHKSPKLHHKAWCNFVDYTVFEHNCDAFKLLRTDYNVIGVDDHTLEFRSAEDATIFILKWSS